MIGLKENELFIKLKKNGFECTYLWAVLSGSTPALTKSGSNLVGLLCLSMTRQISYSPKLFCIFDLDNRSIANRSRRLMS